MYKDVNTYKLINSEPEDKSQEAERYVFFGFLYLLTYTVEYVMKTFDGILLFALCALVMIVLYYTAKFVAKIIEPLWFRININVIWKYIITFFVLGVINAGIVR